VIVFLDEPACGLWIFRFITVTAEQVRTLLTEVVAAAHAAGALARKPRVREHRLAAGIPIRFDIINFDAFTYFDRFVIYRGECLDFLARGGNLAWGIVPTSDVVRSWRQHPRASSKNGPPMCESLPPMRCRRKKSWPSRSSPELRVRHPPGERGRESS